ncbi:MAG: hypothetical protein RL236_1770, partial [Pseudomonadota bacterium]
EVKRKDDYLLDHDVHEQAISHKLACYIGNEIGDWNVDAEYNRNKESPKSLNINGKNSNVRPDILIHRRGKNNNDGKSGNNNLVIIEVKKKPTEEDKQKDIEKIKAFINDYPYYYKFGAFVSFNGLQSEIEWFERERKN